MQTKLKKPFSGTNLLCFFVLCASLIIAPNIFAEELAVPKAPEIPKAPEKPKVPEKPKAPEKPKVPAVPKAQPNELAAFLKRFDLDNNKIINVDESMAIQEAYRSNPEDPMLKKYDKNKDSQLSDVEIMQVNPPKVAPVKPKPKPKPAKPAPAKPKKAVKK